MALIAEAIVEEWLVRQGYFTIRNLRVGLEEIDLLAVKYENKSWKGIHVEVQVSIRPVRYVVPLSRARQEEYEIHGSTNAKKRSDEQLQASVTDWINKKFFLERKEKLRAELCPGKWSFLFVHGKIRHPNELALIKKSRKVKVLSIGEILKDLKEGKYQYATNTGRDLIELMTL